LPADNSAALALKRVVATAAAVSMLDETFSNWTLFMAAP
jgi:hypothetical protein